MKRNILIFTTAVLGLSVITATATLAHSPGVGFGQGMGQGMGMGQGSGYNMMQGYGHGQNMGQGYGHGMMQGYGHGQGHGMMQGYGHGQGLGMGMQDCLTNQVAGKPLTVEDVRANLETRLEQHGNDRLKVGDVVETDDKTIIAEIVTVDDSLVHKIQIDKITGRHTPVQ